MITQAILHHSTAMEKKTRVVNIETIKETYERGHGRIPIYEGNTNQIVGIL